MYLIFVKDKMHDSEDGTLTALEKKQSEFLFQFRDCFSESLPDTLLHEQPEDHAVDIIPRSSTPNKPPYRVSLAKQEEIMSHVKELLEKGLAQPSSSPYCSRVLLVHKKDGSWCMCINYMALNKITIKNRFPIPRINDILDLLKGSAIFNRTDLKNRYHQIRIRPEDVNKIAFNTTFTMLFM